MGNSTWHGCTRVLPHVGSDGTCPSRGTVVYSCLKDCHQQHLFVIKFLEEGNVLTHTLLQPLSCALLRQCLLRGQKLISISA